jgi:transcriptional regulator with XRE-family HTH domain
MQIGRKIAKIRYEKGVSQQQLEILTGIAQQQISKIESGEDLRVSHLLKIAQALEIPIEQLVENKCVENIIKSDSVIKPIQINFNINVKLNTNDSEKIENLLEIIKKIKNL